MGEYWIKRIINESASAPSEDLVDVILSFLKSGDAWWEEPFGSGRCYIRYKDLQGNKSDILGVDCSDIDSQLAAGGEDAYAQIEFGADKTGRLRIGLSAPDGSSCKNRLLEYSDAVALLNMIVEVGGKVYSDVDYCNE